MSERFRSKTLSDLMAELRPPQSTSSGKSEEHEAALDELANAMENSKEGDIRVGLAILGVRSSFPKGHKGVWTRKMGAIAVYMESSPSTLYRKISKATRHPPIDQRSLTASSFGKEGRLPEDRVSPRSMTTICKEAISKDLAEKLRSRLSSKPE
jgi:hypothetical protein